MTEMMVVVAMFGVVGSAITGVIVSGLKQQNSLQDRSTAIATARTAIERIDRDVSAANPLSTYTATQLVMTEIPNETVPTATRLVTYSVISAGSSSQLVEDETDTSSTGVVSTLARRVLVTNLVNPAATPVFSYDSSTETITVQLVVQPATLHGPVTVTDGGTTLRNPPS